MSAEDEKEKLINLVKRQVKLLMEEVVTKKYIHEDSSSVLSLCALVEACLSHGLKRRAIGLFRTNTTTALVQKLAKHFGPAAQVINILNGNEQPSASTSSLSSKHNSPAPSTNHGTSPLAQAKNKPIVLGPTPPLVSNGRLEGRKNTTKRQATEQPTSGNQTQPEVSSFSKPLFYSSSSSSSSPSPFSPSCGSSSSPGSPSPTARFQWIRIALFTKNLTAIIEQIYKENSTYYERSALMSDPLQGPLLVSLLVGPCALDYSRLKVCEQMWSDAPADELLQRHKIHSTISAIQARKEGSIGSPKKSNSLKVNKNGTQSTTDQESTRCISSAKEYIESLHQNNKNSLIYGKNNVAVQPNGKNEPYYGYLSLHKINDDRLLLKWTPNQIMNTDSPIGSQNCSSNHAAPTIVSDQKLPGQNSTPDKSVLWEYASCIDMSDIVYLHCHQKSDRNDSIILVGHDGVQRPPLNFPKGNHLLTFLTCLENGLAPTLKLDPPLWNHRKMFPKLAEDNKLVGGPALSPDLSKPYAPHPKSRRQYLRTIKTADGNLYESTPYSSFNLRRSMYKGNLQKDLLPRSLDNDSERSVGNSKENFADNHSPEDSSNQEVDYVFRITKVSKDNPGALDKRLALESKGSDSPFWNFWSGVGGAQENKKVESPTNRFVFPPTPPPKTDEKPLVELDPCYLPQKFWTICHPFTNDPSADNLTTTQNKEKPLNVDDLPGPPTPPPSPLIKGLRTEEVKPSNDVQCYYTNLAALKTPPWTKGPSSLFDNKEGIDDYNNFNEPNPMKGSSHKSTAYLTEAELKLARQSMNTLCKTMRKQILSRAFYGWFTYSKHLNTVRTHLADLVLPLHKCLQLTKTPVAALTNYNPEVHSCQDQLKYGLTSHVYALTQDGTHRIVIPELFLRAVYFGGVDASLRKEVWPYLLGYFEFNLTPHQKSEIRGESKLKYDSVVAEWIKLEVIIKERDKELLAAHLLRMSVKENSFTNETKEDIKNPLRNSSHSLNTFEESREVVQNGLGLGKNKHGIGSFESFTNIFRRLSSVSPFSRNSFSSSSNATSEASLTPVLSSTTTYNSSRDEYEITPNDLNHKEGQSNAALDYEQLSSNLQQITHDCQKLMMKAQKSSFESDSTVGSQAEPEPNNQRKFQPLTSLPHMNGISSPTSEDGSYDESPTEQPTKPLHNGFLKSPCDSSDAVEILKEDMADTDPSLDKTTSPEPSLNLEGGQNESGKKIEDKQPQPQTPEEKLIETLSLNIHRIDKDVLRCDRNYWYFSDSKNLEKLRNVVCSYVWTHLDNGYFQGMCDLAAPLLVIFDDEVMAYECFTKLMDRMSSNFPMGNGMDTNFANMRSLIEILDPELYNLMQQNGDYTHFYFCYRWFLLDFKRELTYDDIFLVWETIWAARFIVSDHFVLFIALAFVEFYRGIILENNMDFTDIIKFFNEMAEKHPAKEILSVARNLVQKLQCLLYKDE